MSINTCAPSAIRVSFRLHLISREIRIGGEINILDDNQLLNSWWFRTSVVFYFSPGDSVVLSPIQHCRITLCQGVIPDNEADEPYTGGATTQNTGCVPWNALEYLALFDPTLNRCSTRKGQMDSHLLERCNPNENVFQRFMYCMLFFCGICLLYVHPSLGG